MAIVDATRELEPGAGPIGWEGATLTGMLAESERLFAAPLAPVCSPKLRSGPLPLSSPADLQRHTLLRDEVTKARSEELGSDKKKEPANV